MCFYVVGVCRKDLRQLAERCVHHMVIKTRQAVPSFGLTEEQFELHVKQKHEELWARKRKPKAISAPFDNPHRCKDFIVVAEKLGGYKDLQIATKDVKTRQFVPYLLQ